VNVRNVEEQAAALRTLADALDAVAKARADLNAALATLSGMGLQISLDLGER